MLEGLLGKTPAVRGAVFEWFAAVLIGFIPLIAHFVMQTALKSDGAPPPDWTPDVVFAAITTSASGPVGAMARFSRGVLVPDRIGRRSIALMAMSLVLLAISGMLYGAVASGHAAQIALKLGWSFLAASAAVSLVFELTLAAALVENAVR